MHVWCSKRIAGHVVRVGEYDSCHASRKKLIASFNVTSAILVANPINVKQTSTKFACHTAS